MVLNDRIDINTENEQVQKQRAANNKKCEGGDIVKKDRKGFCTSCTIF